MPVGVDDVKQAVRQFVLDNFMMGGDQSSLADSDSFIEKHIVDSTGFIELVSFLEQTYALRIEDDEMVPDNLDSLQNIARFIHAKAS